MSSEGPELNPLLNRVDALLRRHQEQPRGIDDDVPVLTEIAESDAPAAGRIDRTAVAALAEALERAVLDRLGSEVDRIVDERLAQLLGDVLEQTLRELRSELGQNVRQMVREAVAASVTQALAEYRNPEDKTDVA